MKRFVAITAAALLLVALAFTPAQAAWYYFQVQDEQGRPITSGFVAQVYTTVSSSAADAIFGNPGMTTVKTNPINPDSNGVVTFATNAGTVDVVIWGQTGNAQGAVARVKGITDREHRVTLNTQNEEKHLRFFWDRAISKGAEVSTGIQLPVGAMVTDVWVEVATGGVFGGRRPTSVSVGLLSTEASGDTDGFCSGQAAEKSFQGGYTKYFRCAASMSRTVALEGLQGNDTVYYSSNTRGALLASFNMGQRTPDYGIVSKGFYVEYPHVVQEGAANTIVYQTTDVIGAAGYIHIFYKELRVR